MAFLAALPWLASAAGSYFGSQQDNDAESYSSISASQQQQMDSLMERLQDSYQAPQISEINPDDLMNRWKTNVGDPMEGYWNRIGGSEARERANLPGSFVGSQASKYVQGQGENFMMERMGAPLFGAFQQAEQTNAQIRMQNANLQQMSQQLGMQGMLGAGQLASQPTQDWALDQGTNWGSIAALLGFGASSLFGGGGEEPVDAFETYFGSPTQTDLSNALAKKNAGIQASPYSYPGGQ